MENKLSISIIWKRLKASLHCRIIFAPGMDSLYRFYQEIYIRLARKKPTIKVLFIVGEASMWKSEILYCKMLEHPRFTPVLGITESQWVSGSKPILIDYICKQGYDYIDLDVEGNSISKIKPDIKIYYKPYEGNYRHGVYFDFNMKSMICFIHYSTTLGGDALSFRHELRRYAWKEFVENEAVVEAIKLSGRYFGNKVATGLPLQDYLSLPKEYYKDPWKGDKKKKRIIYAPHHSFKGTNGSYVEYATFLDFGEFVLQMAEKYADNTQWVFKPHPSLHSKLIGKWGKERADAYYQKWASLPNAQIELSAYNDIFKYSDAMIHDSYSFLVEYLYAEKPVLFLEYETQTAEQMHLSQYGYDAYVVHYHAQTEQGIESFIQNVIAGVDPRKGERDDYFEKYLRIPNGKTACENIMDVILGE